MPIEKIINTQIGNNTCMLYNDSCRICRLIISAIVLFLGPLVNAQISNSNDVNSVSSFIGGSVKYSNYQSYSQTNNNFPMKAGYPVFLSRLLSLEGNYYLRYPGIQHHLGLSVSFIPGITSDDGTDKNFILNKENSSLQRTILEYNFFMPLFSVIGIQFRHGFASSLMYENRKLVYLDGVEESKWDFNTGLGGILGFKYNMPYRLAVSGDFKALFYIPYTSFGRLTRAQNGENFFSSSYRPFTYQTQFRILLEWEIRQGHFISAGYRKNDLVGFGNQKPSFSADHMISYRIDRLNELFVQYKFRLNNGNDND